MHPCWTTTKDGETLRPAGTFVGIILLLAPTVAGANISLPFEAAAKDAPIVVVARAEQLDDGSYRLSVIRQIRGVLAPGSSAHTLSHQLLPEPVDGKSYFVLLDRDMWPWPLSPDLDPKTRVQAFMCGTHNALEIVDDHGLSSPREYGSGCLHARLPW